MSYLDDLIARNPSLARSSAGATPAAADALRGIPPGMVQIVDTIENVIPTVEKITGLSRRDIFMALLKSGLRGGGVNSILNSLMGHQEKEAKFVKYVKTLAIWVPIALLLLGLSVIAIVAFAKFMIVVLGGL